MYSTSVVMVADEQLSGSLSAAEIASLEAEVLQVSASFETASADKIIGWALGRFSVDGVSLACSFQDAVTVHLATSVNPDIEVLFLDTGFHFPETLEYVETLRRLYNLNLTVVRPGEDAEAWPCGSARCCEVRKVSPMYEALAGRKAWITGLKRVDAPTRSDAPIVSWDDDRGMVKVNPLATWSDEDVARYVAENGLAVHPLASRGYLSIGCAPTTRPVSPGEDPRAGRWSDTDKIECGLHG